jgi:hypothetical protein
MGSTRKHHGIHVFQHHPTTLHSLSKVTQQVIFKLSTFRMHKIEPWFLVFNIFQPKTKFYMKLQKKLPKNTMLDLSKKILKRTMMIPRNM